MRHLRAARVPYVQIATDESVPLDLGRGFSLVVVAERDGRDQASGDRGQDVLTIGLAPFVAVRRSAQVMLAVVDVLSAVPVVLAHMLAVAPMMVGALVLTPSAVVGGLRGDGAGCACDKRQCRNGENERLHAEIS